MAEIFFGSGSGGVLHNILNILINVCFLFFFYLKLVFNGKLLYWHIILHWQIHKTRVSVSYWNWEKLDWRIPM